jgi:hypothetical protein
MAKDIEPKLRKIKEYLTLDLNGAHFRIPEYQRPYSWKTEQCDKLLQDIQSFIESGGTDPYFFGTIILDCSDNQLSLIDGQQRTTSFLLLLKAILLILNKQIPLISGEESESLKAGLEGRRKDILRILYFAEDEDVPGLIKDPNLIKSRPMPLDNYSINETKKDELKAILQATSFEEAEKAVYHDPHKRKDNTYTDFFRNFKFFYNKMLEKNNSQLSEFAKTFLNSCQVIEIRSWDVEQAIVMFNSLNSTGLPLSDADVLSAELYSNANGDADFLQKWADLGNVVESFKKTDEAGLQTLFSQYMYILRAQEKNYGVSLTGVRKFFLESNYLSDSKGFVTQLTAIGQNWCDVADDPLAKLLSKFNLNARFFMAAYMYSHGLGEIQKPFEAILRLFAILEVVDTGYSSKQFKQFLFQENLKLVDKAVSPDEIVEDFRQQIIANWKKEDILKEIKDYRGNVLVPLNEYVYCRQKGLPFFFGDTYNVEHIMPASGKNIVSIRTDAGILDVNAFRDLVDQLGNKIMLEEDINKSIGNEWFKAKKQNTIDSKMGYQNSQYKIAKALVNYPKDLWTKEDIEAATDKAVQRIVDFLFE